MRTPDLCVFDFDGTLVETAGIKRQGFFDICPQAWAPAVDTILTRHPDGSRHDVVPAILAEAERTAADGAAEDERYEDYVLSDDVVPNSGMEQTNFNGVKVLDGSFGTAVGLRPSASRNSLRT